MSHKPPLVGSVGKPIRVGCTELSPDFDKTEIDIEVIGQWRVNPFALLTELNLLF